MAALLLRVAVPAEVVVWKVSNWIIKTNNHPHHHHHHHQ
jgi:hypothetical protein